MCHKDRPNRKEFLNNLMQPMPVSQKARLFLRNNLLKLISLRSCCGNNGQPGC
ncbi:MAG: hypothetical protein ACOC43_08970 [Desulfohalobiaceae bacterium]